MKQLIAIVITLAVYSCSNNLKQSDRKNKKENNQITSNIDFKENGSTKTIAGKIFSYVNPYYEYIDNTSKTRIRERPEGILNYSKISIEGQDKKMVNSIKLEFLDNNQIIHSIDLNDQNPYKEHSNSKWLGKGKPNFEEQVFEEKYNINKTTHKKHSHYTDSQAFESEHNYIFLDQYAIYYNTEGRINSEIHTITAYNSKGETIAQLKNLTGTVDLFYLTKDEQYIFYRRYNQDISNGHELLCYDLKNDKYIKFNTLKLKNYSVKRIWPLNDNTENLICIGITSSDPHCKKSYMYIDLENNTESHYCMKDTDKKKQQLKAFHIENSTTNSQNIK